MMSIIVLGVGVGLSMQVFGMGFICIGVGLR